jgi:hypothetical protein
MLGQIVPGSDGAAGTGTGTGGGTGSGGGGAAGDNGLISHDASLADSTVNQDGPCSASASTPAPAQVALYLVLDRSMDMQSQNLVDWDTLLQGLDESIFATSQLSTGQPLQVGLTYYPIPCPTRPIPHTCGMPGTLICDLANNSDPYSPVANVQIFRQALMMVPTPATGGQPVLRIAADGAMAYVKGLKANATFANRLVVPVIIAGGPPDPNASCTPNSFDDVQQSLADAIPQTKTFVIAYDTNNMNNNQLDSIAQAGGAGTQAAFAVNAGDQTEQQLERAFSTILDRSCAVAIPPGIDPKRINVELLTPDAGVSDSSFVNKVDNHHACSDPRGGMMRQLQWYYDDPQSPRLVIGCDYTCQVLHNVQNAALQILTGCDTVTVPGIR